MAVVNAVSRKDQIVFFDLETTTEGDKEPIEFGAIIVDPVGLYEKDSYSTFIKLTDKKVTPLSIKINGITDDMLRDAPTFDQVCDRIYGVLDGRKWAGYNIVTFDMPILNRAFERVGRTPPKPTGVLDVLPLLRVEYAGRVPSFKLADLSIHFGHGAEQHRALADARLTLAVLKSAATVLFLEKSAPSSFTSFVAPTPVAIASSAAVTHVESKGRSPAVPRGRGDGNPPPPIGTRSPIPTPVVAATVTAPVTDFTLFNNDATTPVPVVAAVAATVAPSTPAAIVAPVTVVTSAHASAPAPATATATVVSSEKKAAVVSAPVQPAPPAAEIKAATVTPAVAPVAPSSTSSSAASATSSSSKAPAKTWSALLGGGSQLNPNAPSFGDNGTNGNGTRTNGNRKGKKQNGNGKKNKTAATASTTSVAATATTPATAVTSSSVAKKAVKKTPASTSTTATPASAPVKKDWADINDDDDDDTVTATATTATTTAVNGGESSDDSDSDDDAAWTTIARKPKKDGGNTGNKKKNNKKYNNNNGTGNNSNSKRSGAGAGITTSRPPSDAIVGQLDAALAGKKNVELKLGATRAWRILTPVRWVTRPFVLLGIPTDDPKQDKKEVHFSVNKITHVKTDTGDIIVGNTSNGKKAATPAAAAAPAPATTPAAQATATPTVEAKATIPATTTTTPAPAPAQASSTPSGAAKVVAAAAPTKPVWAKPSTERPNGGNASAPKKQTGKPKQSGAAGNGNKTGKQ